MRKSVFTAEYTVLREALRQARHQASLSQRDLARRLRVPHSWVAKVESGERRIDLVESCWFLAGCGIDPLPPLSKLIPQVTPALRRRGKGAR